HEMNTDLGTINMNGRLYDPTENRFLTPDPLITNPANGQDWNHYSYVDNNPTNYTDPSGYAINADGTITTCVHKGDAGCGSAGDGGAAGVGGGYVTCGHACTAAEQNTVNGFNDFIDYGNAASSGDPMATYRLCQICSDANHNPAADPLSWQIQYNQTANGSDDTGTVGDLAGAGKDLTEGGPDQRIAFNDTCVTDIMSGACLQPGYPEYDPDGLTKALAASAGAALGMGVMVGAAIATGPAIVVLGEVGATCGGTGVCQKVADEIEAVLPEAEVTSAEAEAGSAVAQEVVQKIVNANEGAAARIGGYVAAKHEYDGATASMTAEINFLNTYLLPDGKTGLTPAARDMAINESLRLISAYAERAARAAAELAKFHR
ncbi:RHS repeat-associated core domain-containing protein, partial [Streptomyces sp. NPDC005574]|uniref:RHS repeat-associated core domain-containing protein n=1 Tax=Streptomyces sp. NPDC005574 TaxID=3156891 RepID=UPI0033B4B7A8